MLELLKRRKGDEKKQDKPYHLLVVDDSVPVRKLLRDILTTNGEYTVDEASNGREALDRLEAESFDMVISDIRMPVMDGISLLSEIRERFETMPVIMITGFGSEIGPRTLELGADDCVYLPFKVEEFKFRVARALRFQQLVEMRESLLQENIELWGRVITDQLTGLYNRQYFDDVFGSEFARALRYKTHLGIIIFDIDFFKKVNDVYGHLVGDQVLKDLGSLVQDTIRKVDIGARYGGEEFVLILSETVPDGIQLVGERLREIVANHQFTYETPEGLKELPQVTISLGAAHFPDEQYTDAREFFRSADDMLYQAKRGGRNRLEIAWR